MDTSKRDAWLDGLRAVAVLLVLGRHADIREHGLPLLSVWHRGGWVGVDLFFVLSGFLVSGLLFREYQQERDFSMARFLIRRGLRIYPAFYVLLFGTLILTLVLPIPKTSVRAYVAELLFVQNYFRGVWNHTWSLAVEEHFYLTLPLLLIWLLRSRRGENDPFRGLVPITVTVIIALTAVRCVHGWWTPFRPRTHLYPTHLRADALLAGVLLAYFYHFRRAAFERVVAGRRGLLAIAGTLCFVPVFVFRLEATWFIHSIGLALVAAGGVMLIAAGVGQACAMPIRMLAPMGRDSYSTYLWHMPVLVWGAPLCEWLLGYRLHEAVRIGVYIVGSVTLGAVMARLTEAPMLRLRERWFPSRSDARSETHQGHVLLALSARGRGRSHEGQTMDSACGR
jgi:peptidoglycan/LPS O-acetylase OafA/YrhL